MKTLYKNLFTKYMKFIQISTKFPFKGYEVIDTIHYVTKQLQRICF